MDELESLREQIKVDDAAYKAALIMIENFVKYNHKLMKENIELKQRVEELERDSIEDNILSLEILLNELEEENEELKQRVEELEKKLSNR